METQRRGMADGLTKDAPSSGTTSVYTFKAQKRPQAEVSGHGLGQDGKE